MTLHVGRFGGVLLYTMITAYCNSVQVSMATYISDDLPLDDFFQDGDLMLGSYISLFYSKGDTPCQAGIRRPYIQFAQSLIYQLSKINRDSTILPNTTLGLSIVNDCSREPIALAKTTQFLPRPTCSSQTCPDLKGAVMYDIQKDGLPHYDVMGIMGPTTSTRSIYTSTLLGAYRIPQVSWGASNDELSDKAKYRYFSRIVTPDRFIAKAMVDLMVYYNWTYISTVNSGDDYGRNGVTNVIKFAKEKGICIAYSGEASPEGREEKFEVIVKKLKDNYKARIVVMFMYPSQMKLFAKALEKGNALRQFILFGADTFGTYTYSGLEEHFLGTFAIVPKSVPYVEFEQYYESLSPWRNTSGGVWYGEYTPDTANCVWNDTSLSSQTYCGKYKTITDIPGFGFSRFTAIVPDVVNTFAYAFHELIQENCPDAFGNRSALKTCVNGDLLLSYIRGIQFKGLVQDIAFDENGDLIGGFDVTLVKPTSPGGGVENPRVGSWSRLSDGIVLDESLIQWYVSDLEETSNSIRIPESVCAKPCGVGEFYIQGELKCCWTCRRCRSNEYVKEDQNGCELCPLLTWPDQTNFTTCIPIPPTYLRWHDALSIGLEALGAFGILFSFAITAVFIKHRSTKVIRGSSRELVTPIILGMYLSYFCVFMYLIMPTTWSCYLSFYGFHLSCTLILGPLFLKTLRMYRIFAAAEKCQQRVRMVDASSQVAFVFCIIILEICSVLAMAILHPPLAIRVMPVQTEPYTELLCDVPLQNLVVPLSLNLLFIILCALFGFLTRKLPDNFNESWYIFISVSTTLFVWIAFLPTYIMAFFAYHKAALLSLALILNASFTGLCLFLPKIYAVYFVDEKDIKTTNFSSSQFSSDNASTTTSVSTE